MIIPGYVAFLDYIAEDLQASAVEVLVALGKAEVLYRLYESRDDRSANILRGIVSNFKGVLATRKFLEETSSQTETSQSVG